MQRIYQAHLQLLSQKLPFDLAAARAVYIYSCDSIKVLNVLNHLMNSITFSIAGKILT